MLHCNSLERVEVSVFEGQARFAYADGTSADVPTSTIARSSLLKQAVLDINTSDQEGKFTICVPEYFLSVWFDALERAHTGTPSLRTHAVLEMCLAADFFDDPKLLKFLCQEAAAWVFEPSDTFPKASQNLPSFYLARLKALDELPVPLITAVLDACSKAVHAALWKLPESSTLPLASLRAAFQEAAQSKNEKSCVPVNSDACKALWQSLPKAASLESLWIQRGSLDMDFVQQLALHLPTLTFIRDLRLESLGLCSETAATLAPSLSKSNLPHLTRLSVADNPLGYSGITAICEHLVTHTSLVDLRLRKIQMCSQGAEAFATCLRAQTKIRNLDLSFNPLGADGVNALECELGQLSFLRRLYVRNCALDAVGANSLVHSIVDLTKLVRLDLGQNRVISTGVEMYAAAMSDLTTVRHLSMNCKDMTLEAANLFGHALEHLSVLERFQILDGNLTAEVIRVLAEYLSSLPFLSMLELGSTCFKLKQAVRVAKSLSRLRSLRNLCLDTSEECSCVLRQKLPGEVDMVIYKSGEVLGGYC